jgi:RNA polymerase sigma-70 factor (ECF subfamily)
MTIAPALQRSSVARVGAGPARDELLLARIRAGDDAALASLYDEHCNVVFGVARRVTRDEQLARDVCQEVFAYLWEMPDRVDLRRGSLRTFLAMVAHRRAVDELRRRCRRSGTEPGLAVPAQYDGPEDEVVEADSARWRGERLAAVLDQLPEEQRVAVRLAYFDGLTYKQVAAAMSIPEGTAKSRLRLALARLRRGLDAELRGAV